MKLRLACAVAAPLSLILSLPAQTAGQAPPPLIQFSNVATDESGNTLGGVVSMTFSLYNTQQGGEPLWTETQNNVQLDSTGHYSVQLGITKPNGVPTALFTTGQARWLGVQIAQQPEQPRVLLVSVPYALKAGDAQTIGGLPPSAFVLAAPPSGATAYAADSTLAPSTAPPSSAITGTGTVNYLPLWDTTSDIISSVLFQSGTGSTAKIGVGTATPASTLDIKGGSTVRGTLSLPAIAVATATKGADSQPLNLVASAFNSGTSAAANQTFRWQAEPAGNDTSSPAGTLNLLFGEGTSVPSETGLNIANNGQIKFASGQTFPGTGTGDGTVTSVASGAGLTGGPITGAGTLSIATGGVTNAMLANPSLTVAVGTGLTGGGSVALGASTTPISLATNTCASGSAITALPFTCSPFAALGTNTFTGNQTINGNILLPNTTSGGTQGVIELGGLPFIHNWGPSGSYNAFVGRSAGNLTNSGGGLAAVGAYTLTANTTGSFNTASGYSALYSNTTGSGNSASGAYALFGNSTGGDNAASGGFTLTDNTTGSQNTASGYQSLVQNTTGGDNTASGYQSLLNNNGSNNSAYGVSALSGNTTGSNNTGLGYLANVGSSGLSNATAIGANAIVSASNALVLGGTGSSAVNVGIGTATPAFTLDVQGTGRFTGAVTFASSQTFPGVAELGTANTFTGNQTVTGNLTATNLTATSSVSGGVVNATTGYDLGGVPFDSGSTLTANAFLGFAGNGNANAGSFNTAVGYQALANNGSNYNTAVGISALSSNTSGTFNTATGEYAGQTFDGSSVTGSDDTAVGTLAGFSTGSLNNATAIGANAEVSKSNALVLGAITGTNSGTSVSVGIGTSAPAATLDVRDNGYGGNTISAITANTSQNAVYGSNTSTSGNANGAYFYTASPAGTAVVGVNGGTGGNDYAGWFGGNVYISGNLAKGSGSFKIDHPLDPANKYLYHSFVESPDMMNIYNGVATLDARGSVWITLPDYFEALNQDFRYQLTSIGRPQPSLYVAKGISGNRFRISGGKPGGKVSWQVTGVRHDAYADANRIQVEVAKPPQEQGRYLHPELFGAGAEQAIGYQAPPAPPKPPIEAESHPEQSLKARPARLR
jgi:hypothetical protein